MDEIIILNNISLSICNNPLICAVIDDLTVFKAVQNNSVGCNSVEEIVISCLTNMEDINLDIENNLLVNQLVFYPNPVSETLTISISENITYKKAIVYSFLGEKLVETSEKNINFSSLAAGIYFVEIETDLGNISKKIIKE